MYYFEKINDSDESSVKYFLQDCVKNLEEKRKNISYSLSYQILRIGSRQSSKHLRIYQKRDGLEFELEIKKQFSFFKHNKFQMFDQLKNQHLISKWIKNIIYSSIHKNPLI